MVVAQRVGDEAAQVFEVFAEGEYTSVRYFDWLGFRGLIVMLILSFYFVALNFLFGFQSEWE